MGDDAQPADRYDVAILGGGLAGLSLALQLKQADSEMSVFLAEKREGLAPEAAFKVGESTVEVSAYYFADVLGLREHLEHDHLHKFGLRWWFPAGDNSEIAERIERGPSRPLEHPTFQLDRGRFENYLVERMQEAGGVDRFGGVQIQDVDVDSDPHVITFTRGGETRTLEATWVVDASGRAFTLKRKLDLFEENGHDVNAAWFRLAGGMDIEDFADPDDEEFFGRISERGIRQYSTNHLCGKGYWVWMIPLASETISIGIVSDPRFHPFEQMSTIDGAIEWLRVHEPQLGERVDGRRDQIEDFLHFENFSYSCKQCYDGARRWALVGEAGAFLDPFYSPGSDFISMSNTFTSDLITRDLSGEDVTERARAHNRLYLDLYSAYLVQYEGQYEFWGNPLVMTVKICANNIFYWGTVGQLFFHRKLTDLDFMAAVRGDLERVWAITRRLEAMYREWNVLEDREWRRAIVSTHKFPGMIKRHNDLNADFDDETLKQMLASTADLMEGFAVIAFHRAAQNLGDAAPGEDEKINPYAVSLDPERWEADGLTGGEGLSLVEARQGEAAGLENLFLEAVTQPLSSAG
jgi:2-polyprenyl-6-methoxyphenol hydroxylase-like FAD-dependent oxidoreductase